MARAWGRACIVCLPAEQVTLAGFAQNGEADTMAPGPLLATIVDTVTGEDGRAAGCSDDQLMGVISAARRMASRAEWTRWPRSRSTPPGMPGPGRLMSSPPMSWPSSCT